MKEKLKAIQEKAMAAFQEAKEMKDIDDLKVKYLGKKGELTAILKEMGKLSAEERPIIGQMANDVRQNLEKMLDEAKNRLAGAGAGGSGAAAGLGHPAGGTGGGADQGGQHLPGVHRHWLA